MENNKEFEKNKGLLTNIVKQIGKSRINFEEKEIDVLAKSKNFHFTDYLKKIIILNRVIDKDENYTIEKEMKKEYDNLLIEKKEIEENKETEKKRYKNICAKTDYGLPFFMMSSYFEPKTLNKIEKSKQAEDVVYKLNNEIERRSKKSYYFKKDKERAVSNVIVNIFKEEFPKAAIENTSKASLNLNNEGFTPTKAAALTMNKLCSTGVLSSLVKKTTKRCDGFINKFKNKLKIKEDNRIKDFAKKGLAVAATAAVVALVGHEAMSLIHNVPFDLMPSNLTASIDLPLMDVKSVPSGINNVMDHLNNDTLDLAHNTIKHSVENTSNISDFLANKQIEIAKPDIIEVTQNMTLDNIADTIMQQDTTITDKNKIISALSEINDLSSPNHIITGQEIELPTKEFLNNYTAPQLNFDLTGSKQEVIEQLKNITINYGETKSELIEKITNAASQSGILDNIKENKFINELNKIIPEDLKAYDEKVPSLIKDYIGNVEKIKQVSSLKFK